MIVNETVRQANPITCRDPEKLERGNSDSKKWVKDYVACIFRYRSRASSPILVKAHTISSTPHQLAEYPNEMTASPL